MYVVVMSYLTLEVEIEEYATKSRTQIARFECLVKVRDS